MEHSINTEKNWQSTVSVSVTAEDVKAQYENALNKVRKDIKLEGFRKGKVPAQMVKKLYGSLIDAEAEELCVQKAWQGVFEDNSLYPINDPQVVNMKKTDDGGMTFNIVFDVYPKFEVKDFDGMPVEKTTFRVEKADVDKVLDGLRERNAMLYSIEEEAKEGYFIFADLQEVDASGVPIIGQKIDNQQIWLNADDKELTPQLLGVKAEESRNITLQVKSQQSEIVDQPEQPEEIVKIYQVDVKEIKERRLPELDDEFAKDMGPYETLQELLDKVEKDLVHEAEHESEHAFENALSESLLEKVELEVPQSMLNNYLDNIVKDAQARNKDQAQAQAIDPEEYRNVYRTGAVRDLKWHLVSEQLKRQEQFVVSDEDVEKKIAHFSEHGENGIKRAEEIRANEKELAKLKDGLVFDQLYAFLAEKATISEVDKTWSELVDPKPADANAENA